MGSTFTGAVVLAGGVWALFNLDKDDEVKPPAALPPAEAKKEEEETEELPGL